MLKAIAAFVEDDFVLKLIQNFFQSDPKQTSEIISKKEKLKSVLKGAIEHPSEDLCSTLTIEGFNSDVANLLRTEYKKLKDTELLDDVTRRRIWKAFEGLLGNVDTDKLLADSCVKAVEEQSMDQSQEQMESSEDSQPVPAFFRKRILAETPLVDLYTEKGKKGIKKEFFRCQHIRAEKKAMRLIEKNALMKKGICPINPNDCRQMQQWTQQKRILEGSKRLFAAKSTTLSETRSFNNQFCYSFYSSEKIRLFHFKFSDMVYKREPAELCANISTKCCLKQTHTAECARLWEKVRIYIKFSMLEELGFQREMLEREDMQEV